MTPSLMAVVFAIVEQLDNLPPDLSVFARYLRACEIDDEGWCLTHHAPQHHHADRGNQCYAQAAVMDVYESAMRLVKGD